jgi:imidazolonepropionase-like amidohydrolase
MGVSWIGASDAGMQSIEHMQTIVENIVADPVRPAPDVPAAVARLDGPEGDAIFAALARNRTFFCPTLIYYENMIDDRGPEVAARRRQFYPWLKHQVGRANAAGVRIIVGTDMIEDPATAVLDEIERLVDSGLTPVQALRAATSTAAEAARQPALGRIRAGGPASFILVDADPRSDVRNLRRLSAAVLRGRLIESDELAALRAPLA